MVTPVVVVVGLEVTVKTPDVAPAAIVIEAGTVAVVVLLDDSDTTAPLAGAGESMVTVPTDVPPAVTAVGFSVKLEAIGGLTTSDAVFAT